MFSSFKCLTLIFLTIFQYHHQYNNRVVFGNPIEDINDDVENINDIQEDITDNATDFYYASPLNSSVRANLDLIIKSFYEKDTNNDSKYREACDELLNLEEIKYPLKRRNILVDSILESTLSLSLRSKCFKITGKIINETETLPEEQDIEVVETNEDIKCNFSNVRDCTELYYNLFVAQVLQQTIINPIFLRNTFNARVICREGLYLYNIPKFSILFNSIGFVEGVNLTVTICEEEAKSYMANEETITNNIGLLTSRFRDFFASLDLWALQRMFCRISVDVRKLDLNVSIFRDQLELMFTEIVDYTRWRSELSCYASETVKNSTDVLLRRVAEERVEVSSKSGLENRIQLEYKKYEKLLQDEFQAHSKALNTEFQIYQNSLSSMIRND